MIYLDNAATTKIHPEVLSEMMPYLTDEYGNAGTSYGFGISARAAVDKARSRVASFVGAKEDEIIFTSGGTESNNMVFESTIEYLCGIGKKKVITSNIEHSSIMRSSEHLRNHGFDVIRAPSRTNGQIDMDTLCDLWDENVGLVSVMFENNELGSVNDVEAIGKIARENGTLFHTDCVQAAGWHSLDVEKIGCDFLSLSSHKIHGPKGVGALYCRNKDILTPLIFGGESQEFGYRGGTENVAGIVGFGKACEMAGKNKHIERACSYGKLFTDVLNNKLGHSGWKANSDIGTSKILSLCINGVDAETLVLMLNTFDVCVSAGSACRSREMKPSYVLKAIGLSDEEAMNTIRISFSTMNTDQEVVTAALMLVECINVIKDLKGA